MLEQRLTHRLTNYWRKINDGHLPPAGSFNPGAIIDLWPFCLKVALHPLGNSKYQYLYEYHGEKLVEAYGRDLTGERVVSRQMDFPGGQVLRQMEQLLDFPIPIEDGGQFINDKQRVVKYRACLLPLGKGDNDVTHVVAGISWKAFG